jgi:hypothetical protein
MTLVEERRVLRWFYNGKGYGSKLRAYKAAAKDALMTEVFGPIEQITVEKYSHTYQGRRGFAVMDELVEKWVDEHGFYSAIEKQAAFRKQLFEEKMRDFGFVCEGHHGGDWRGEDYTCPEDYGFCGRAYKAWITAKAHEMMRK